MYRPITLTALLALLAAASAASLAGDDPSPPVELGRVVWQADLDAALKESAVAKKPVLLLFQEIPG